MNLLIANRYRVEDAEADLLGQGSMGEVYRATGPAHGSHADRRS